MPPAMALFILAFVAFAAGIACFVYASDLIADAAPKAWAVFFGLLFLGGSVALAIFGASQMP
jgi:hypothetical protein